MVDVATAGDCPHDTEGVCVNGAVSSGAHSGNMVKFGESEYVGVIVRASLAVDTCCVSSGRW